MRKPRALTRGDRIAVVAPASPFDRAEFDSGIAELRRLGFDPVYDESVFARKRYVAGEAQVRAAAIRSAWRDPSIAGVIGVRGGYGSARLRCGSNKPSAASLAWPITTSCSGSPVSRWCRLA